MMQLDENTQEKQLFAKNSLIKFRAFLLVVLSLALIIGDNHFHRFTKLRSVLSVVAVPIQYLVNWPIKFVVHIEDHFVSHNKLLNENKELQNRLLLLQAKVQKFMALEKENSQLRALLSSSAHLKNKMSVAQILAVNLNPFDQQVVLDKGTQEGVYIGQPVLDAYGVAGQVIEAGPITSRVLLITSSRSAVPVQDSRNGIRAIAIGDGYSGGLKLIYLPNTVDIKVGDLLVTSGLGLRYPVGYPLGVVNSVECSHKERFADIKVTPSAQLNSSRQVLLVWNNKNQEIP